MSHESRNQVKLELHEDERGIIVNCKRCSLVLDTGAYYIVARNEDRTFMVAADEEKQCSQCGEKRVMPLLFMSEQDGIDALKKFQIN